MDQAKGANMPKDNWERAIKKGTGELEGVSYEEITYEGQGPGGTLYVMDVVTDNRNRTAPELRKIFDKHGGTLGAAGSAAWAFDPKGVITLEKAVATEEQLFEIAVGAGAGSCGAVSGTSDAPVAVVCVASGGEASGASGASGIGAPRCYTASSGGSTPRARRYCVLRARHASASGSEGRNTRSAPWEHSTAHTPHATQRRSLTVATRNTPSWPRSSAGSMASQRQVLRHHPQPVQRARSTHARARSEASQSEKSTPWWSSTAASGHVTPQAPQSMHFAGSMTCC